VSNPLSPLISSRFLSFYACPEVISFHPLHLPKPHRLNHSLPFVSFVLIGTFRWLLATDFKSWTMVPGEGLVPRLFQGKPSEELSKLMRQGKMPAEEYREDRRTWDWYSAPLIIQDPFWPVEVCSLFSCVHYSDLIFILILLFGFTGN
jgi:hypothetical protein